MTGWSFSTGQRGHKVQLIKYAGLQQPQLIGSDSPGDRVCNHRYTVTDLKCSYTST